MSTYLSLTNELLRRMGEVIMDVSDFDLARNVQAIAKNAINSSVREILHSAQEWPFTLQTQTETLVAGTGQYNLPANASSVDWDSFYLKKHATAGNEPQRLAVISYVNYLDMYRNTEENTGAGGYGAPEIIYQTQELKFGVSPKPDVDYQIEYKYWLFPTSLSVAADECIIPSRFDTVVVDGGMMYMMLFRSNEQSAAIHREKFDQGIKSMRRLLLDEPMYMRSTMVVQPTFNPRVL